MFEEFEGFSIDAIRAPPVCLDCKSFFKTSVYIQGYAMDSSVHALTIILPLSLLKGAVINNHEGRYYKAWYIFVMLLLDLRKGLESRRLPASCEVGPGPGFQISSTAYNGYRCTCTST